MAMYSRVVGISFKKSKAKDFAEVKLVSEPDNKFDPLALAVYAGEEQIGYIGKEDENREYLRELGKAKVARLNHLEDGETFDKFEVGEIIQVLLEYSMPKVDKVGLVEKKCVISGQSIWMDEAKHHYYNNDGERMMSGSAFCKLYEKEFDSKSIANKMAQTSNHTAEEILHKWDLLGQVATQFGTSIHTAMELYGRYGELTKHPIIKPMVEKFFAGREDEQAVYEAFVISKDGKLCGEIDRLVFIDKERKAVRVGDFKSNTDIHKKKTILEPFDYLPQTTLGLYQLQLAFYAHMVMSHGYVVDGVDIYWYDYENSEWVTFSDAPIDITNQLEKGI